MIGVAGRHCNVYENVKNEGSDSLARERSIVEAIVEARSSKQ